MTAVLACLLGLSVFAAPASSLSRQEAGRMEMNGMFGSYAWSREASGTSWQPDSTPHEGMHLMLGDWMVMAHGFASEIYDHQGGPRGGEKWINESMLMLMGQRPLGPGTAGLRGMFSLDPAMGPSGYPLLLQSGETSDGRTPLVDRQHPHDLFMELAGSYSLRVGEAGSAFAYFGLPGEPALGPPAFMHRFSGMDNPEAPITHHWLDSTHVAFGVGTLGFIRGDWKLEGSVFTGREPDQFRWDIEPPRFDSQSVRLSYNPSPDWALQASYGRIVSPEALEPEVDLDRITASASYNLGPSQTTFAWGENRNHPGRNLDAFLLESAVRLRPHTVFGRVERVDKDELAPGTFTVNKLSLGYIYEFSAIRRAQPGVGIVGSVPLLPAGLRPSYDRTPGSLMLFVRVKLT